MEQQFRLDVANQLARCSGHRAVGHCNSRDGLTHRLSPEKRFRLLLRASGVFLRSGEGQQVFVEAILMSEVKRVRRTFIDFELRAWNQRSRRFAGHLEADDRVAAAMNHERRHIEFLQVRAKVRFRKSSDAIERYLDTRLT